MHYPYIHQTTIPSFNIEDGLEDALNQIVHGTFNWNNLFDNIRKFTPNDTNLSAREDGGHERFNSIFDVINRDFDIETEKNESGEITNYVLKIEHTPFKKSEIKVSIEGPRLHVKIGNGNVSQEKKNNAGKVIARNIVRESSDFSLDLTGMNVIRKKIVAKCEDGILRIDLPVYPKSSLPPPETEIPIG